MKDKILWCLEMPLDSRAFLMQKWKIDKLASTYDITIVVCNENVGSCYLNPFGIKNFCRYCSKTVKESLKNSEVTIYEIPKILNDVSSNNVDDLGAISTFITKFRRTPNEIKLSLLRKSLNKLSSAGIIYKAQIESFLGGNSFKSLWTFGGRTNIAKAAVDAAVRKNVDYYCMELAGVDGKIHLSKNQRNFDSDYIQNKFSNYLKKIDRKDVKESAVFFEKKLKGEPTNDVVYYKPQKELEKRVALPGYDIIFLLSSLDERAALGGEWDPFYESQEQVCVWISNKFPQYKYAVRYHPNQSYLSKKDLKKSKEYLEANGIMFFGPKSEISSYDLIPNAKIVVTFGSTISVEAAYQKKRVLVVGHSFSMGVLCHANSFSEIYFYLSNPEKIPLRKYRAMAYAHQIMNYSAEFCDVPYVTAPRNILSNKHRIAIKSYFILTDKLISITKRMNNILHNLTV